MKRGQRHTPETLALLSLHAARRPWTDKRRKDHSVYMKDYWEKRRIRKQELLKILEECKKNG